MSVSIVDDESWNYDCTEHTEYYSGEPHKRAIDKAWKKLADYMNPTPIIEYANQEAFFPYSVIRDIREFRVTSDKNTEILKRVRSQDHAAFNRFKSYLRKSNQSKLAELLECLEMGKDIIDKVKELDDIYKQTSGYGIGIEQSVHSSLGQTNPKKTYDGNLVFSDQFDGNVIDASKWKHEISTSGGGNWEFQIYSPEPDNSYIKDHVLYLRPTLTADKFGEQFLYHGILDVTEIWGDCTNTNFYGGYRDSKYGIISPVMSAKLMLQEKFSFRYGRVEVEAKMPIGDWIWPSIQLLPRENYYGEWPKSGRIIMAESRGNLDYGSIGVENITCTLHWGTQWNENRWEMTSGRKKSAVGTWGDDFHTYYLDWTPNNIILGIDDIPVMTSVTPMSGYFKKGFFDGDTIWCNGGKNAPFDREFSLQFSLAVGGTNDYFPDFVQNVGYEKPWCNRDPRAAKKFYESKDKWMDTWNGEDAALKIRSVKIWSDKIS